jgi:MFS family permease
MHPPGGIRLLLALALVTALSQFLRSATGAIAPELMRDLAMAPEVLGAASGAFFAALAAMQIPVGLAFDRWGARRTVTILTIVAALSCLGTAAATNGAQFVAARAVSGIGCGASFMAAVLLIGRWYAGRRMTTVMSWVFAISYAGVLAAASPIAWAAETIGWRAAFTIAGVACAAIAMLSFWSVSDRPDGDMRADKRPDGILAELKGVLAVWKIPSIKPILCMHMFPYAVIGTMVGVWAGPYLNDVHGLSSVARGHVMSVMVLAQVVGVLFYGPLDRLLDSRKRVVTAGALSTIAVLLALALWPRPPLVLAIVLLTLLCFVTAYAIVIVAHGRSLFPDHLAGRGVTTVNLAQALGTALMPTLTGIIVGVFVPSIGAGASETGYRVAFGAMAALLSLGTLVYVQARDVRPSETEGRAG